MKRLCLMTGILTAAALMWAGVSQAAQIAGTTSGECIDIPHGVAADGTQINQFHCHGTPNEQWTLSNGQISGLGGSCLDVMGSAPTEGAQIIIVACKVHISFAVSKSTGMAACMEITLAKVASRPYTRLWISN